MGALRMYAIYKESEHAYRMEELDIAGGEPRVLHRHHASSIDLLRRVLPPGLERLAPPPDDAPELVETWL
jgi:hypothetical protein